MTDFLKNLSERFCHVEEQYLWGKNMLRCDSNRPSPVESESLRELTCFYQQ